MTSKKMTKSFICMWSTF